MWLHLVGSARLAPRLYTVINLPARPSLVEKAYAKVPGWIWLNGVKFSWLWTLQRVPAKITTWISTGNKQTIAYSIHWQDFKIKAQMMCSLGEKLEGHFESSQACTLRDPSKPEENSGGWLAAGDPNKLAQRACTQHSLSFTAARSGTFFLAPWDIAPRILENKVLKVLTIIDYVFQRTVVKWPTWDLLTTGPLVHLWTKIV